MKLLERIKQFFFGKKTKMLPSTGLQIDKIALMAITERDPDDVLTILKNYGSEMKSESIVHIISSLPVNRRIKAIELTKKSLNYYDLLDLALRKLDYTCKIDFLEKFQNKLDLEDIYRMFDTIPPDQRSLALEKCLESLDSFGIAEIIRKYVPLYERLECFNKYSSYLDGFSKAKIIQELDDDRKITALKQYKNDINRVDLFDIICSSGTDKITDVLDSSYKNLTPKQIMDIIQYNIPNEKKLETMYKCCDVLDSSTITDLIKFVIPDSQKEEALIAMQNRIKSNNIGELLQFCVKTVNALNKVQHNLDAEDIEYFKNNL